MRTAALFALASIVCVAAASASQKTTWEWRDDSKIAALTLTRESSGPLVIAAVSAVVSCPGSSPRWELATSLQAGITVRADGSFSYDGPADETSADPAMSISPTLKLSGVISGRRVTGTLQIGQDGLGYVGNHCRALSQLLPFTASCETGCPKPPPAPATLFPGLGVGGSGLLMRGIAKLDMTEAQVRALHRIAPARVDKPQPIGGVAHVALSYDYRDAGTNGFFEFYGFQRTPRLVKIVLIGPKLRTATGVKYGSRVEDLKRAYPAVRCTRFFGGRELVCRLRSRGATTDFELANRPAGSFLSKATLSKTVVR